LNTFSFLPGLGCLKKDRLDERLIKQQKGTKRGGIVPEIAILPGLYPKPVFRISYTTQLKNFSKLILENIYNSLLVIKG